MPEDLRPGQRDGKELPYAALDEVLRRAALLRTTGYMTLRIDFNQGSPRAARIGGGEEEFKLTK